MYFEKKNMNDFVLNRYDGLNIEYIKKFYDCSFEDIYKTLHLESVSFYKRGRYKFRKCIPRRKVCAFSDFIGMRYCYSGQYVVAKYTWPPLIKKIKLAVENKLGEKFNFALVNYYPDGDSQISKHQDDETCLDSTKPIACISFGAERQIVFRKIGGTDFFKFSPKNGSLYVMKHPTNKTWTHEIPKQPRITKPRISITFRVFN